MADIDDGIAEGAVPASVSTFADLHSYVGANDYLQAASVPFDASNTTIELTVAIHQEVTRRLQAPDRPWCTFGACAYPKHDHTTILRPDGDELPQPVAMRCQHGGPPAHYDEKLHQYRHDDPPHRTASSSTAARNADISTVRTHRASVQSHAVRRDDPRHRRFHATHRRRVRVGGALQHASSSAEAVLAAGDLLRWPPVGPVTYPTFR